MNALVFRGVHDIQLEQVPIPASLHPTEVLVKIDLCGLCGSDMHPYHGREVGIEPGTIMGHEFVGTIQAVGTAITHLSPGDRVMSPFTTNCGSCFFCKRGLTARCDHSQVFGWRWKQKEGETGGGGGDTPLQGLDGAQAQFIVVPQADSTLVVITQYDKHTVLSDEEALLLGDVLSTGYFAAYNAGVGIGVDHYFNTKITKEKEEERLVIAVVGCGPVGLSAIAACRHLTRHLCTDNNIYNPIIIAIDGVEERLEVAKNKLHASYIVNPRAVDAVEEVGRRTGGRGADVVIEAVGLPSAFELAKRVVRAGGVVSVAGCHSEASISMGDVYNKNLTVKSGRCSARRFMEELLPMVDDVM